MNFKNNKFITDPIYGEIEFDEQHHWAYQLIQTKEFKRLMKVKQLGECWKVFFGANHTRYSHSIGVYHIARQFLKHLKPNISDDHYKAILAAALLHDIGHGPRSHSFELYTNHDHETMSKKIILSNQTQINQVLKANNINIQLILDILQDNNVPMFYHQIISSQIDADRLDYLMRDSYHVGTKNGSIDLGLIVKWSYIVDNQLVFQEKAINLIESILFARYQMFKQIYLNKKSLCYEQIVCSIFRRIKDLYQKDFKFKDKHNLLYLLNPFLNDVEYDVATFLDFDDTSFDMLIRSFLYEEDETLLFLVNSYVYQNRFICENKEYPKSDFKQNDYYTNYYDVKKKIYDIDDKLLIIDAKTFELFEVTKYSQMLKGPAEDLIYHQHIYFHLDESK